MAFGHNRNRLREGSMGDTTMAPEYANESGSVTIKFGLAILAVWLVAFLPMESGPIWIPAARMHFGVSAVAMGIVASCQFAVSAAMAMFVAPRIARRKLRAPLLGATAVILVDALATAALPLSFPEFILGRFFDGAASGLCVACAAILATRTRQPSRSFGLLQFGQILTNMVVYVVCTKLAVAYGISGVYSLLAGGAGLFLVVQLFGKGWPIVIPRGMHASAKTVRGQVARSRIWIACLGAALVYCGFIALVANASALGTRAGLDFARVTVILAAGTPAAAIGALISTLLAGRVPGFAMIAVSAAGAAIFGLFLTFTAYNFETLTVSLCGVIFFIYIGFPSIFGGISRLDETGRSASAAQAAQMFGPALGPAVGALIAAQSISAFAFASSAFVVCGAIAAGLAIKPASDQPFAVQPVIARGQS
jgi:predicted MFS family arabinose efflux permease